MIPRSQSDEKYILERVAEVLAEPDYRWQHRFPTLLGDPGRDGRRRPLPVDGYFPRHQLVVEYWEKQHSAPVPIMDEGESISGVSRGHQRRLYDQRRQQWAAAHGLRFLILDYRGFDTDEHGRLHRDPARDRHTIARALRAAGVLEEPSRVALERVTSRLEATGSCFICSLIGGSGRLPEDQILWRGPEAIAFPSRFPTVYGSVVVAPAAHVAQVTGDFTLHEYLALQRIVYAVAEAVRCALRPKQVYLLSAQQSPETVAEGQRAPDHLHWQVVPSAPEGAIGPPGWARFDAERQGVLDLDEAEYRALVALLRPHLPTWMKKTSEPQ